MLRVAFALLALLVSHGGGAPRPEPWEQSRLTLDQVNPQLGDTVTFTAVYPGNIKNAQVEVRTFQPPDGTGNITSTETKPVGSSFVLGGTLGDPAQVYAQLFYIDRKRGFVLLAATFFNTP